GPHLSTQEIEALLRVTGEDSTDFQQARRHLESCAMCRFDLLGIRVRLRKEAGDLPDPGQACPDEAEWPQIASGTTPGERAEAAVAHAASCDRCGARLAEWTELLQDGISDEEEAVIAALPSSSSKGQRQL